MLGHPLIQALEGELRRFDFFQLLRLLECIHLEKARLGYGAKPSDDWLRLRQEPSMAFSSASFAAVEFDKQNNLLILEQFFFGIFGPNGPLPLHLTEYARERIRNFDDESFARFADVFHHRLLSFFYRSWADAKPHVSRDRPQQDGFSRKLASFFGKLHHDAGEAGQSDYLAQCFFAGRLAWQTRNEEGLIALLSGFFHVPVAVEQFVGSWVNLPAEQHFRLAGAVAYGSLGEDSTLGERVWDCQSKFTLVLGPLNLHEYQRFLPGTGELNMLQKMVKDYLGNEFDWNMQLLLKHEEVQPLCLGGPSHLGWSTWLPEEQRKQDFDGFSIAPQRELTW